MPWSCLIWMGCEGSYWDMRLHILFVNLAAVDSSVPNGLHTRIKCEKSFALMSKVCRRLLLAVFGNIFLGLSYLIFYYPGYLEKSEVHQNFFSALYHWVTLEQSKEWSFHGCGTFIQDFRVFYIRCYFLCYGFRGDWRLVQSLWKDLVRKKSRSKVLWLNS